MKKREGSNFNNLIVGFERKYKMHASNRVNKIVSPGKNKSTFLK